MTGADGLCVPEEPPTGTVWRDGDLKISRPQCVVGGHINDTVPRRR